MPSFFTSMGMSVVGVRKMFAVQQVPLPESGAKHFRMLEKVRDAEFSFDPMIHRIPFGTLHHSKYNCVRWLNGSALNRVGVQVPNREAKASRIVKKRNGIRG